MCIDKTTTIDRAICTECKVCTAEKKKNAKDTPEPPEREADETVEGNHPKFSPDNPANTCFPPRRDIIGSVP